MKSKISQSEALLGALSQFFPSTIATWCMLSAAGAFVLVLDAPNSINPDGVAYLDMASETIRRGPMNLVNGWWGPLYPALLAAFLLLFRPSASGELLVVHFLNWILFVGAAIAFGFFLKCWFMKKVDDSIDLEPERKQVLVPLGFCLFFWSMHNLIGIPTVTPDILLAGLVFLSAGIGCRILKSAVHSSMSAMFGLTLALCYFAKPAGFAVAVLALATLLAFSLFRQKLRYQIGIATLSFLVLSTPFIVLMTKHVGRLSVGETGTGNYLIHVNQNGAGQRIGPAMAELLRSGTLLHPPRVLLQKPLSFDFTSPVAGVYPWHDEFSYWIAGARIRFNLRQQINAVIRNLRTLWNLLLMLSTVSGGVVSLLLLTLGRGKKLQCLGRSQYWIIIWSLFVCGTFTLVYIEGRYVAPFVVLLCLLAFRTVMGNIERVAEGAVLFTVLCALLIPITVGVATSGTHIFKEGTLLSGQTRESDDLVIADAIGRAGVKAGDSVAVVGSGYSFISCARRAGVRIMVEIPDEEAFWNLTQNELMAIRNRLADVHIKALLTASFNQRLEDHSWSEVKGLKRSHFWICPLLKTP
jgi:hypothetical protein